MSRKQVTNLATIAVVAALVIYASNNDLPIIGGKVRDLIG